MSEKQQVPSAGPYYICQEIRTLNVYEAVQAGELREAPVFMDVYSGDPVLQGRHVYEDGGWTYVGPPPKRPTPVDPSRGSVPPECAKDCKWRQRGRDDYSSYLAR